MHPQSETRITETLLKRGFTHAEATQIAREIVRNLRAYEQVQERAKQRIQLWQSQQK